MAEMIVILVVLFIVNAFIISAILVSANRISNKVNKYFIQKISEIVPPESEDFKININKQETLNNENENPQEEIGPIYVEPTIYGQDFYKTDDLKENYKSIRERMVINNKQVIKDIINENREEIDNQSKVYFDLLEILNLNTIYDLNTLSSSEQLNVLNESFTLEQKNVLNDFVINDNKEFNVVSFYEYIVKKAKTLDSKFYIKTGWREDYYDDMNKDVVTLYDEEITEGIKIVHKDKIYDYSI